MYICHGHIHEKGPTGAKNHKNLDNILDNIKIIFSGILRAQIHKNLPMKQILHFQEHSTDLKPFSEEAMFLEVLN